MCVKQARRLRRNSTEAERRLWSYLRNRNLANLTFRRQHPLNNRIVDFFCDEVNLAIELDGSGHSSDDGQRSDLDREIELYDLNFPVALDLFPLPKPFCPHCRLRVRLSQRERGEEAGIAFVQFLAKGEASAERYFSDSNHQ